MRVPELPPTAVVTVGGLGWASQVTDVFFHLWATVT